MSRFTTVNVFLLKTMMMCGRGYKKGDVIYRRPITFSLLHSCLAPNGSFINHVSGVFKSF
jgi:hypothetical protein